MHRRFLEMLRALSPRERTAAAAASVVFMAAVVAWVALAIHAHSAFVPVRAGSYREGVAGQPVTLNPAFSSNAADQDLGALIYSRLTDLTTAVEADPEYRTFTVKLAENLTWEDGAPLTSDDVVFTVKTIQDPDARSPFAASWRGVVAERVSELQVTFTLPSPYAFFRTTLARLSVVPKHIFGTIPPANLYLSSYNLEPVGSGPYRVASYATRRDGFITEYHLVPNPRYPGPPPFIQDFYFRFFPDTEALREAFRLRQIDGFGLSLPPVTGAPEFGAAVTERIPMSRYYAVFMNQLVKSTLKDERFRRALGESVDRERIVREVFGGVGTPLSGSPAPGGATAGGYDPLAARDHLAAAKVADAGLVLAVPQIPALQKVAERLKEDWNAIGIAPVTIVSAPPAEFADTVVRSRNYELLLFGNTLENQEDWYPFWHSTERLAPGLNFSLYESAEADRLLEANRQTEDPDKRVRNLERLATAIERDVPAALLFSLPYLYIHRDTLEGFRIEPMVAPADRFRDVTAWNVARVRVVQ